MREQHREQLEKVRAAVNDLTGAARYVEDACPTGSSVIVIMRDAILRLLDEAEKPCKYVREVQDNPERLLSDKCDQCGMTFVAGFITHRKFNFCPGCGREIERGSEG